MAWPHLGGLIKVKITYGFNGVPSVNVHFVLQRTPLTPVPTEDLEDAADSFWTAWVTSWKTRAHEDWSVEGIEATDWSGEDGEAVNTTLSLPIAGIGVGADACPASVAIVASHRTGLTGRARRGRNYIAGLSQAEVDGNTFSQGIVTDIGTLYAGVATNLAAVDMDQVVLSLVKDGVNRTVPLATIVTGTLVNSLVDTQRRRIT